MTGAVRLYDSPRGAPPVTPWVWKFIAFLLTLLLAMAELFAEVG